MLTSCDGHDCARDEGRLGLARTAEGDEALRTAGVVHHTFHGISYLERTMHMCKMQGYGDVEAKRRVATVSFEWNPAGSADHNISAPKKS